MNPPPVIAFAGFECIAAGAPDHVARLARRHLRTAPTASILVFDQSTAARVELDLRQSTPDPTPPPAASPEPAPPPEGADVDATRPADVAARGPGRPRLGVVPREVTLLPRHWEWLAGQPGGASVALRKLVEEARRQSETRDRLRTRREATYRFMSSLAGDLPGFEEASRALFAGRREGFEHETSGWPEDVRKFAWDLASGAF